MKFACKNRFSVQTQLTLKQVTADPLHQLPSNSKNKRLDKVISYNIDIEIRAQQLKEKHKV